MRVRSVPTSDTLLSVTEWSFNRVLALSSRYTCHWSGSLLKTRCCVHIRSVCLWACLLLVLLRLSFFAYGSNTIPISQVMFPTSQPKFNCKFLTTLTYLFHAAESFWETNRFSVSQEIPRILWNPKVHYRSHKCPPPVPILSQLDPVHSPTSYFLKINLNIILSSTPGSSKWSLSHRFPHQNPVYASPLPHTRYMPCPSHSSPFYRPKNIGWAVQIVQLLIMQFSPLPCYFFPRRSKYSPQHPVLKHPQHLTTQPAYFYYYIILFCSSYVSNLLWTLAIYHRRIMTQICKLVRAEHKVRLVFSRLDGPQWAWASSTRFLGHTQTHHTR